jgi:tripartite ATP-independent transporter DctP family solute receptor
MSKYKKIYILGLVIFLVSALMAGCGSGSSKEASSGETASKTDPIVIKLAHPNVPKHPMGQGFIKFKEMVESRSNGTIQVDIFDSSKFGNAREVVEGLQTGMLQMGSASIPNLAPFTDGFLVFDMPFLFPDYPSTDKIKDGPIGKELSDVLEDNNIIGLGYIEIGFRNIFNNVRPIEKLEDLKGLKIRSTSSKAHIATLNALGANPTPVAWGEAYTALQQGTVDGIDIDLNLAYFNNFHEVQKYLTVVNSIYSPHLVMISKKFNATLTPEQQKIISEAVDEMKVYQRDLIRENEKMAIEKMKEAGVKVTVLSPEERQRWAEATSSVYDEFEDIIGKDLIKQVKETVQQ